VDKASGARSCGPHGITSDQLHGPREGLTVAALTWFSRTNTVGVHSWPPTAPEIVWTTEVVAEVIADRIGGPASVVANDNPSNAPNTSAPPRTTFALTKTTAMKPNNKNSGNVITRTPSLRQP
jgi:hypothetical protein